MVLSSGSRIGPYEISGLIGAGGMGEVFRAVDVNLGRVAAIKVLPQSLASDPERLARFEREAQTLAVLNHPNIAQVFGFEKGEGNFRALAMEFVDGPTLADRINGVPVPLDEAIPIAAQIADALESAHDRGIIHRDLKPLNIKVRPDGTVKVLDFGLAKAISDPGSGIGDQASSVLSNSPTVTTPAMTHAGVVLGTASYMSPEQAKGRVVDRRTDIWAFGCVLFEMLTSRRAFAGEDVSDVMVSILRDEPKWSLLPADTPPHVLTLLRRCLEKDLRKRLPHIGVARLDLIAPPAPPISAPRTPLMLWRTIAVLALLVAIGVPSWMLMSPRPMAPASLLRVRTDLSRRGGVALNGFLAISRDGRVVAFSGRSTGDAPRAGLFIRMLDQLDAEFLPGTEGGGVPFFSPDGRFVAFFAGGSLKKVATSGGSAITVCDAPQPRGGWWDDDDSIIFSSAKGLQRVAAAGGEPKIILDVAAARGPVTGPQALPGGRGILYGVATNSDPSSGSIMAVDANGGVPREVVKGGRLPRYLPSGHLTFVRGGVLYAMRFDLATLQPKGESVPVVDGVAQDVLQSIPNFAISDKGTLAYQAATSTDSAQAPIMWLRASGPLIPLRSQGSTYSHPRFSPDGTRVAMAIVDGTQADIWVYDWQRDILTRITREPAADIAPVWTPDGTGIVFGSNRGNGVSNLFWQRADGTGAAQRLTTSTVPQLPDTFSPDGRSLVLHEGDPTSGRQTLTVLPIESAGVQGLKIGQPFPFVAGPSLNANARFAPDGKWVAYSAFDTGSFEVYVEPFPGPGPRVQISNGGGNLPVWSPKQNELYYAGSGVGRMMAVAITAKDGTLVPARPRPWSETQFSSSTPYARYGPGFDIHPDGQRFLVTPPPSTAPDSDRVGQIVLTFNLFDELRRLAPIK